jgi:hypothetical protein
VRCADQGNKMTISRKNRKRLRDLHARMGSNNSGEREAAWRKLDGLLKRLGKSWNHLPELLHDNETSAASPFDPRDDPNWWHLAIRNAL